MKPSLSSIVNSMPSPVDPIGATVHVNRKCGIKVDLAGGRMQTVGLPDEKTSYSWSEIFAEMTAQGYQADSGEFHRKASNQ